MSLIIPAGFCQVLLPFKHSSVARKALITFGLDVTDAAGDFDAVQSSVIGAWTDAFNAFMDTEVTVGPCTLRIGQDGGDPLVFEGDNDVQGTGGSASLPSNVALLVRKRSALGGRRGRGRFYIPWIISDDSANDVGIIPATPLGQYVTGANTFLDELETAGAADPSLPMVILHDSSGVGVEPGPTPVTSLNVDSLVATQRRRLARS